MKDKIMNILIAVVIVEIIFLLVATMFATLGAVGFNLGCVYRYDKDPAISSDSIAGHATLRGDGNYTSITKSVNGQKVTSLDPNSYGKWVNTNVNLNSNQVVDVEIDGTVSLCQSYLPVNNIASNLNVGPPPFSSVIPIPRVEDTTTPPVTLIFDATTPGWRNLLELYQGDIVEVIVNDNPTSSGGLVDNVTVYNVFTGKNVSASCAEGQRTYSPICGRWSIWNGDQAYVNQCTYNYSKNKICGSHCCDRDAFGTCWSWLTGSGPCYNSCQNNIPSSGALPQLYKEDGSVTIPNCASNSCSGLSAIASQQCSVPTCNNNIASCNANCSAHPPTPTPTCADACQCTDSCASCTDNYNNCVAACPAQNNPNPACSNACVIANSQCRSTCCASACTGAEDQLSCTSSCQIGCTQNAYNTCLSSCNAGVVTSCQAQCQQDSDICANAICEPSDVHSQSCIRASGQAGVNAFNNNVAKYLSWFSARDVGGLMYRISNSSSPDLALGGGYQWATIQSPDRDPYPDQYTGRKIYSAQYNNVGAIGPVYLQYRFFDNNYINHTGGYVFQVKHTKCQRIKGAFFSDTYKNRGQILYVISNKNPNTDPTIAANSKSFAQPNNGKTQFNTGNLSGNLWLKIDNRQSDYVNSVGSYRLNLSYNQPRGAFVDKVLTPLITIIKNKVDLAGMEIFMNLLCIDQNSPDGVVKHTNITGGCSNFFNYIKAMLILYIITYSMMFLTGIVKASYQDIVIRVVKVGIVAGLLSGQTFLWFNSFIFNFVVDFSDQIIANFAGFSNISAVNSAGVLTTNLDGINNNTAAAPFMFMDTLFSKLFFSQTFLIQVLAVMGIGAIGLIYFVIIGVALVILVIVGLRAVAVYIIAMIATAFLLTLAPIFLTFMLFEQTYYLFENWYKAVFRYMLEPVIMMVGVIVLTQIFTLYLDNVLSYSACWKCAMPFYIPFASILPLPGLANMPLFCIYWFAPWGLDSSGAMGQLGMDLSAMTGLVIIAFALYGYSDLASSIASSLTSAGVGSPSSIKTGVGMAREIGQFGLKRFGLDDQTQQTLKQEKIRDRQESRAALKQKEQEINAKEKELGIKPPEGSNALTKGLSKLTGSKAEVNASTNMQDARDSVDHTSNLVTENNVGSTQRANIVNIEGVSVATHSDSSGLTTIATSINHDGVVSSPQSSKLDSTTDNSSSKGQQGIQSSNLSEEKGNKQDLSNISRTGFPNPTYTDSSQSANIGKMSVDEINQKAEQQYEHDLKNFGNLTTEQLHKMHEEKADANKELQKSFNSADKKHDDNMTKVDVSAQKVQIAQERLGLAEMKVNQHESMRELYDRQGDKERDQYDLENKDNIVKDNQELLDAKKALDEAQKASLDKGASEISSKVEQALNKDAAQKIHDEKLSAIEKKYSDLSNENAKQKPDSGYLKEMSKDSEFSYKLALKANISEGANINPVNTEGSLDYKSAATKAVESKVAEREEIIQSSKETIRSVTKRSGGSADGDGNA